MTTTHSWLPRTVTCDTVRIKWQSSSVTHCRRQLVLVRSNQSDVSQSVSQWLIDWLNGSVILMPLLPDLSNCLIPSKCVCLNHTVSQSDRRMTDWRISFVFLLFDQDHHRVCFCINPISSYSLSSLQFNIIIIQSIRNFDDLRVADSRCAMMWHVSTRYMRCHLHWLTDWLTDWHNVLNLATPDWLTDWQYLFDVSPTRS